MRSLLLIASCLGFLQGATAQSRWVSIDAHKRIPISTNITWELPGEFKPLHGTLESQHELPSELQGMVHALALTPNFMLYSREFKIPNALVDTIALVPLKVGATTPLPRVEYVKDSFRLDYHSLASLESLRDFMQISESLAIAITGYYPIAGDDELQCERHGRDRARSVWEFLVTEGIPPSRLSLEGRCQSEQNKAGIHVSVESL